MLLRRAVRTAGAVRVPARRYIFVSPAPREFRIVEVMECSPAQLFAVVSDVDKYSEFVPFCTGSSVLHRRSATSFDAQLSLGFLGFSEAYTSRVTINPVSAIDAEASHSRLFSTLLTQWRLAEGPRPGTCEFDFKLQMQLRSLVHDRALGGVLDTIAAQQVVAFRGRCASLFAAPPGRQRRVERTGGEAAHPAADHPACERVVSSGETGDTGAESAPAPTPEGGGWDSERASCALQIDPLWRQRVEAAFDAHQVTTTTCRGQNTMRGGQDQGQC